MISLLIIITLIALIIPVYVYMGYPVLLMMLDKLLKGKPVHRAEITPTVSLIVSCYNEADVIEQKIRNCLALDYPQHQLEILFVSDGSDDGTDEIIKQYCNERIILIRQEGRLGKTMGLNLAMAKASGEIVVFSDANAMYQGNALKMLVRNFHDAAVGYVVGAAIYKDEEESTAGSSENIYWKYEIFIKQIESKLHSVVGGDGAIYAIRKVLYEPLDQQDINDFVNPLQIIAKGYRGIFDAEAICYEQTAGDFDKEGKRKQRIVNRSFTGLMKNKTVLNPFKYGFYTLELFSHKLLRWLIPFFLLIAAVGITVLAQMQVVMFQWVLLIGIVFTWSVLLGKLLKDWAGCPSVLLIPYYFYLVNLNSLKGILQS
ncbi:MAG: glycosyltransferase family 2 protein, partial [Gammaproteobacteria bacterium]|nr:glycosyltransferase family 2 protein [Gammaproteobacteria bacterium]